MGSSLFNAFLTEANFVEAFNRVHSKGSRGGVDRVSLEDFAENLSKNLGRLRNDIISGQYIPEPVEEVHKPKFNKKNEFRKLGMPAVADKVAQTALLKVVEPLAEKMFLDTSYGYRKNKGHRKAIRRVEHNLNTHKQHWVIRQDVDNFFDTLDHGRMLRLFSELVDHDQRLVELVALWCRSGIVAKRGRWRDVATGVRQGQVISPLLANLYLHELDVVAAEHEWGWVRYADDYVLQCQTKDECLKADTIIQERLTTKLHLQLNHDDAPLANLDQGFDFLGIHFKGKRRSIAEKKCHAMRTQLGWLLSPKRPFNLDEVFNRLETTTMGWRSHYGFLGSGEQFAAIEVKLLSLLQNLIHSRVTEGRWDKSPPPNIRLSLPVSHFKLSSKEKMMGLCDIWRQAVNKSDNNKTTQKVDRKNTRKRKQYRKRQVQTGELFVISPAHFVGLSGNRIIVRQKQRIVTEIPVTELKGITMAEHAVSVSTNVLHYCADKDIPLHIIDGFGNISAVLHKPAGVRAELVRKQIMLRDDSRGLHLARMFIYGKVKNQLAVLKSYSKYKGHQNNGYGAALTGEKEHLEVLTKKIKAMKMNKSPEKFRSSLMGHEGAFASRYWHLVGILLPDDLGFTGRQRKGATDLLNSMLNYGYAILYSRALSAVTRAGLNATTGFLHGYQHNKPVLTYDLVEEFRAPVVDRAVFSMINRGEKLNQQKNNLLTTATCKKLAAAVTARLGTEVVHREKHNTLHEMLQLQAIAVRRHLCDQEDYKPFLSRW